MRVVIIGGAGFIGSALAKLLMKEGVEVCIFDTQERIRYNFDAIQVLNTTSFPYPDVRNLRRQLKGYDTLVHLACTTDPASSMKSMVYDARTNIIPSLKIFQAAIDAGIKKIIFSSSGGTVYGNLKSLPAHEDDEKKPMCAYGVSKLAIEQYLDLYARSNSIDGLSLRLSNPYGPYQLHGTRIGIIAHYLNDIRNGQPLNVFGDGNIVRDYIHIDCVAKAFFTAIIASQLPSGSYNIGSNRGVSINQLIEMLFNITSKQVPVKYTPNRQYDVPMIFLDSTRFQSVTSWRPEISLEEGVLKMWDHIQH